MTGILIKKISLFLNKRYTKKIKPLILKQLFGFQKRNNKKPIHVDEFYMNKKIKKYLNYNYKLLDIALDELVVEHKVQINNNDSPKSVTLTEDAFDYYLNNPHPIRNWFKINLFNIISSLLGFWGAFTGTLALFIK